MMTNISRHCVTFSAFVSVVLCFQHGWSARISLNPQADAFVTAGPTGNLANNNYGAAVALSISAPGLSQGNFKALCSSIFQAPARRQRSGQLSHAGKLISSNGS